MQFQYCGYLLAGAFMASIWLDAGAAVVPLSRNELGRARGGVELQDYQCNPSIPAVACCDCNPDGAQFRFCSDTPVAKNCQDCGDCDEKCEIRAQIQCKNCALCKAKNASGKCDQCYAASGSISVTDCKSH